MEQTNSPGSRLRPNATDWVRRVVTSCLRMASGAEMPAVPGETDGVSYRWAGRRVARHAREFSPLIEPLLGDLAGVITVHRSSVGSPGTMSGLR